MQWMLRINAKLSIPEAELEEKFVLASGPGGQGVNTTSSAVQLRFDAARSAALPDDARERLLRLAGNQATTGGVIVIDARRHRSQAMNRRDARERLAALVRRALQAPRPRRSTRIPRAARRRRLERKRHRGRVKNRRGPVGPDE